MDGPADVEFGWVEAIIMAAKWYIVHAYSNFEKKVAEAIKAEAVQKDLEDKFEEILVPTEEVVEVRKGRKVSSERKYFPGYVLVKMDMTDEAYHLVKNTPKVTGFLGSGKRPLPVPEREVKAIMGQMEEDAERPMPTVSYEVGETVRVTDGHFQSFNGLVEEVDHENAKLKVAINIFGRATPVELEYSQVEKAT